MLDAAPKTHNPDRPDDATGDRIETRLADLCPCPGSAQPVHVAMRDALLTPGKRVRPRLMLLIGGDGPAVLDAACTVEMIHAASLVLDDLPSMDDAALRRGRATIHRRHGEAAAILAAVALIARAFEVLADIPAAAPIRAELSACLARAIGGAGMAAGQDLDVGGQAAEPDEIAMVHGLKTASLFAASARMAALAAGLPTEREAAAERAAWHFGLAFQIRDDGLDLAPDGGATGKDVGADAGKVTFVDQVGPGAAWTTRLQHLIRARAALHAAGVGDAAVTSFLAPYHEGGRT